MWRIDEVKMKIFANLILITFIHHYCIKGAVSKYELLSGEKSSVEETCNSMGGSITIFRNHIPAELIERLHEDDLIWNGYIYTSGFVENKGCFRMNRLQEEYNVSLPDLTIAYCERFCKGYELDEFAIKESECVCLEHGRISSTPFELSSPELCNHYCSLTQDEFCGSKKHSTFYNIYSATSHYHFEGNCLIYKDPHRVESKDCEGTNKYRIACRSRNNEIELIQRRVKTWKAALTTCQQIRENNSYIGSYIDVIHLTNNRGIWLNERKYATSVESKNENEYLEICQAIKNDDVVIYEDYCDDFEEFQYVCKTGNENEVISSTNTYSQTDMSTTQELLTGNENEIISSTNTYSQTDMSTTQELLTGTNNEKHSTSTSSYQQNVSSDIKHSPVKSNDSGDGLQIGGAVGGLLCIAIAGGIIVVFVLRKRHSGPCNKESEYRSQEVRYSTSNGVTNSAYGSGSAYEIIQGNQDRNSKGDYTKINDEDLRISGNTHSKANKSDDPKGLSPPNGPLYMVLEKETTSESSSFSPFTNYESARPIPDQKSNEKNVSETDELKRNADDMEYDHLRQEAYEHKVSDENVYNHADTDNEYSHISQITKTNDNQKDHDDDDDDYTHTGDFEAHSGTSVQNDLDDTYAHAKDNYNNGDGMTEIKPYELAQSVYRQETDMDESKPNTCAQLNTEDGDYSFAKPID